MHVRILFGISESEPFMYFSLHCIIFQYYGMLNELHLTNGVKQIENAHLTYLSSILAINELE